MTEPTTAYSLATIVSAYREALTSMGAFAAASGARVYLSATPARNPAVAEDWDGRTQHGYNGDPAFNAMMSELAAARGWTYDTGAATAISGPGLGLTLSLPCQPADGAAGTNGQVQARYGGADAIHCDAPGTNGQSTLSAGSLRYAYGLLTKPLADSGLRPVGLGRSTPTTQPATEICTT